MIGLIVYLADIYTYVPNILSVERKKNDSTVQRIQYE